MLLLGGTTPGSAREPEAEMMEVAGSGGVDNAEATTTPAARAAPPSSAEVEASGAVVTEGRCGVGDREATYSSGDRATSCGSDQGGVNRESSCPGSSVGN